MDFTNHYNDDEKKENGIFYTPEDIALFMSKKAKEIDDGTGIWLDPCCGAGVLGIMLASIQENPVDFIKNRLIINEKDEKQLKIALKNYKEKFGVVPTSHNQDFIEFDFDIDYIIMNPPYFKYKDNDIYAYFLDKASLISKGFISIHPLSYTNGKKFEKTRKNLLKYKSITLYHFDNIPGSIFKDASVRVSIVLVHNNNSERKTTGIVRWKSEDRNNMIENIDNQLDSAILNNNIFYKTHKGTNAFVNSNDNLENYVCNNSKFPLYIANSPRYYLSASTNKLNRSSQIVIYMKDYKSYCNALILLNSSYLYWWWRTNDSSMSLTKGTLLLLPWKWIVTDNIDKIVDSILISERNSKVYKKNAGKLQENIKHPKTLIKTLNSLFLPENFIELHD